MRNSYQIIFAIICSILIISGCKKEGNLKPKEEPTTPASGGGTPTEDSTLLITITGACVGFDRIDVSFSTYADGTYPFTQEGICFSTTPSPTIDNSIITSVNQDLSVMYGYGTHQIMNTTPNTIYYVRGFVTNQFGTFYSEEYSYTTMSSPPSVEIGDTYQGGIVVEVSCDGAHGLILCSQSPADDGTHYMATQYANNLSSGGFTDWELPSVRELRSIRKHLYQTGIVTDLQSGNQFYDSYWTRLYAGIDGWEEYYYYLNLETGNTDNCSEYYHLNYRTVRYF